MAQTTASAFLRAPEVVALTGLPRSSLYQMARSGDFPSQVKLTAKTVAWHRDAVISWIAMRPAVYDNLEHRLTAM